MSLKQRILPGKRLSLLKTLLHEKHHLRAMEAHNGLSALIVNNTSITKKTDQKILEYDAIWISSLTDSAAKGHPDIGVIDYSSRLLTIHEIINLTDKPLIVDADTGGDESQFEYLCSKLEILGVSAVIIEDKQFPKRNSLDSSSMHLLEDPIRFAHKIKRVKYQCLSKDFMIFARIESFIAGESLEDAIARAEIYLNAGADGIMIHSNLKIPDQIYAFSDQYYSLCQKLNCPNKPLICVPTTYHTIFDTELFAKGFNIVIYANQLLRASHKAMKNAASSILLNERSFEALPHLSSISELFELVGFSEVQMKDNERTKKLTPVVILAAGKPAGLEHSEFSHLPISQIFLGNVTLFERQLQTLNNLGLNDITIVTGYQNPSLTYKNVTQIINNEFQTTKSLHSLLQVKDKITNGFIAIFGDIIFNKNILKKLLSSTGDIVMLIDPRINIRNERKGKMVDFVITTSKKINAIRKLHNTAEQIYDIGTDIGRDKASHEFVGIVKFTNKGAEDFFSSYHNMCVQYSCLLTNIINELEICDVLRYMLKQGIIIEGISIHEGWSEIHSVEDIQQLEKVLI